MIQMIDSKQNSQQDQQEPIIALTPLNLETESNLAVSQVLNRQTGHLLRPVNPVTPTAVQTTKWLESCNHLPDNEATHQCITPPQSTGDTGQIRNYVSISG